MLFVHSVSKKLKGSAEWEMVEPKRLSGELLVAWSDRVVLKQVVYNDFCFEIEFENPCLHKVCWGIFVYANADKHYIRD